MLNRFSNSRSVGHHGNTEQDQVRTVTNTSTPRVVRLVGTRAAILGDNRTSPCILYTETTLSGWCEGGIAAADALARYYSRNESTLVIPWLDTSSAIVQTAYVNIALNILSSIVLGWKTYVTPPSTMVRPMVYELNLDGTGPDSILYDMFPALLSN